MSQKLVREWDILTRFDSRMSDGHLPDKRGACATNLFSGDGDELQRSIRYHLRFDDLIRWANNLCRAASVRIKLTPVERLGLYYVLEDMPHVLDEVNDFIVDKDKISARGAAETAELQFDQQNDVREHGDYSHIGLEQLRNLACHQFEVEIL